LTIATFIAITRLTKRKTRNEPMFNTRKMIFIGYDVEGMAIYREQKETNQ